MQENEAGCCLVGSRIKVNLRPFPVAIGDIEKGFTACKQVCVSFVAFGDKRVAVLYRSIVVIGCVTFSLRARAPVQPGIETVISSNRDVIHTRHSCDISLFLSKLCSSRKMLMTRRQICGSAV